MQLNAYFQHYVDLGKDIFVVDDHHKALAAWALVRRNLPRAPNLITLYHHTDTYEAFLGHAHWEAHEGHVSHLESFRLSLVAQIDWHSDESIVNAVARLKHDEHIDAATHSETLNNAFCIQLSDSGATPSIEQIAYEHSVAENWPSAPTVPKPQRPMTYAPNANRIYALPFDCFIGCTARPHNEDCELSQANEVIETHYLDDQLARGAEISRCLGLAHLEAAPYILDIDLDVFHTRQAISPRDPTTFHRLIRNAVAITVATEAACVDELWLDNDDRMDADELLKALLAHIARALDTPD